MSEPTYVFVQTKLSFAEFARLLGQWFSVTWVEDTDGYGKPMYRYEGLLVFGTIYTEHGMVDDRDMPFTQYDVEVELTAKRRTVPGEYCDAFLESAARYLGQFVSNKLECKTMVVSDLQRLMAVFDSGDEVGKRLEDILDSEDDTEAAG